MSLMLVLHIVFLLIWSAALLYFPQLLVEQLADADKENRNQTVRMQHALYAYVMTPAALLAVAAGIWLIFERGFSGGWLHLKLALVLGMVMFHAWCGALMGKFREGSGPAPASPPALRLLSLLPLLPALLITGVVFLVTGKPV